MTSPGQPAGGAIPWFKVLRVSVLLSILVLVAGTAWQDRHRSTRWREPLFVAIHPIAADDSAVTRAYVDSLDAGRFKAVDLFFAREALRHRLTTNEPFRTRLQPELWQRPPRREVPSGILNNILWSLKLRLWAWNVTRHAREPQDIRLFVLYHDPAHTPTVPHSLGLTEGLIGVVYAFAAADMNEENNVVIAHELLHTVGATDKYDLASDAPRFPDGYDDPDQRPLYPQARAELMAGRRMLAPDRWQQASSLDEVVIGPATAREIRWPAPAD